MRESVRWWGEWVPAGVLATGVALALGAGTQVAVPLRAPLSSLPDSLVGLASVALQLPPEELAVNGASDYLLRAYHDGAVERLGLYVGYYRQQSEGRTIHSPQNCLPGGGWEPVSHEVVSVPVDGRGAVPVNRYLIAREGNQALVYYWYQGRGRVAASEYRVKWDLLRDAAFFGRSEEALVRLVLPLSGPGSIAAADSTAMEAVAALVPALARSLPA
jgi:EpsI family protein